ncbi:acyltransferase family protein [Leptospira sp. GIMC2001]|uniref:acyltransferase family protein n=1 Tax=Leptospira sp. GIMC2001 TaxID=1513297 RepID=UPI00234A1AC2|nr:acyltransferase family protein [Leptospira sp. GIMC2001]WCL50240.1 acyltransferase family protein [Leptospira sp. GIMC2001]
MSSRLIYLDNLRSFALLLGLVFHTAIVYAESVGYAIKSTERSEIFDHFCFFIHSFRMPLFFFLSGYFSEMVWCKKGWRDYLETRTNRLLIPLIVGLILFAPIQYYLMSLIKAGSKTYFEYFFEFFSFAEFGLSHLWFLYYLVIYCFILVLIQFLTKLLRFKIKSPNMYLFLFFSITFSFALVGNAVFPKGLRYLWIDPYLFIFYFSFFFAGILAYKNSAIFNDDSIGLWWKVVIFVLGFGLLALFEYSEKTDPLWMSFFWTKGWIRFFHLLIASLTAWGFIYFFIEFFKRFFQKETAVSVYLRDSSLPIYLIHHPISLVIGYLLLYIDIHLGFKFIFHTISVFLFSFVIYDSIIVKSQILRRLFGMKM